MKSDQLISKVLAGEASNKEIVELESLTKIDRNIQEEFDDLRLLWFYRNHQSKADHEAAHIAFNKLKRLMGQRIRQKGLAILLITVSLTIAVIGTILHFSLP